jgi:hypothetical protein
MHSPAAAQRNGAAQSNLGAPSLGYVYDSSANGFRPVAGIPGSSALGPAIRAGFPVSMAAVAPEGAFALAISSIDGVRVVQFRNNKVHSVPVDGALASPSRMVFSPSGSAALLYGQESAQVQIVTGLPAAPVVQELNPAGLTGAVSALAVADDGSLAAIAVNNIVWLVTPGAAVQLSLPGSAIAFRPGSHDLLSVTPDGGVYLMQSAASGAGFRQAHSADGQSASPLAVQFSMDGTQAYVVNAAGLISAIDLATGLSNAVSCGCTPTALERMNSRSAFRVTDAASLPLWLVEISPTGPRSWFIPLGADVMASQGGVR